MRWYSSVRTLAALLLGGALSATAASGQTNGFVMHCLSARASGAGCVTLANEGLPTSLFRDPAGLVAITRPTFEVNLAAMVPVLDFSNRANPERVDGAVHAYPLGSAAFVGKRMGPLPKLAWAVGFEPVGGFGADFRLDHELLGEQQNYETFFAGIKVGPALAYEVAPGFSLGASTSLIYAQIRDFRMPFSMPPSVARGLPALMQLDPEHYPALFANFQELTAYGDSKDFAGTAFTASLGASYRPAPGVRLSASWSPKAEIDMDGASVVIDMNPQFNQMFGAMVQERMQAHGQTEQEAQQYLMQAFGQAGMNLQAGMAANYDAATQLTIPQTLALGASVQFAPGWKLGLEGVWMNWADAEAEMPFIMTNGDNANFNILLNGNPTAANFTYPFPLRWEDTYSGKVGLERTFASGHALRAGFIYGENPVPENTVFIAFPAISENSVTLGGTLMLGRLPLDVSVVHSLRSDIEGTSPHLIGNEYEGSLSRMSETVITLGTVAPF